jgi:hypothetical protein
LTTAGGTSGVIGAYPDLTDVTPTAGGDIVKTAWQPGAFYKNRNQGLTLFSSYYYYFPAIVNTAQTYTTITLNQTFWNGVGGNSVEVAIYDSTGDPNYLPNNKLATTTIDFNSAAGLKSNTLTVEAGQSMALTKGQLVWIAIKGTGGGANIGCWDEDENWTIGINNTGGTLFDFNAIVSNTLPATWATSDLVSTFQINTPTVIWS